LESENDLFRIALGKHLSYGLFAAVGYGEIHVKSAFTSSTVTDSDSLTLKEYSLNAKYVRELARGTAVNLEARAVHLTFDVSGESQNIEEVLLGGDFYFNRRLSVGAGVASNNAGVRSSDGKTYSVNARAFIMPNLSLEAAYERFLNDHNGEPNRRNYSVMLAARF
jgi:hypothetical protein